MHSGADLDGVDFRPFFDMVVGILFVLLILIGALLFFQQTSQEESASREAERNARVLNQQITLFLEKVETDLQGHGFETRADVPNKSLGVQLGALAGIGADGFPAVSNSRVEELGRTLAADLQCLFPAPRQPEVCAPYDLLRLNAASFRIETGNLANGAVLPQNQFARLLTSEFTSALFRGTPALLNLINQAGYPAIDTAGSLSSAPPPPGGNIGGEVQVRFDFAPP